MRIIVAKKYKQSTATLLSIFQQKKKHKRVFFQIEQFFKSKLRTRAL